MSAHYFLGAISGTSVDGLDLALLESGSRLRVVAAQTLPFPEALRRRLLELGQPSDPVQAASGTDTLDRLGVADLELGRFIGVSALEFLAHRDLLPAAISAIGSHGQTVRHRPAGPTPFTLQIGDPNSIAEITGITTVADFRRRDMAAGGQGAPLVPPFHAALFRDPAEDRAVLNLGGIANLTLLPADGTLPVTGFDSGPANALLDDWIGQVRQQPCDTGGDWAASGRVDPVLLERLLEDPYLPPPPPKSTGREYYNLSWLMQRLSATDVVAERAADVQATLCAFTAESVARALREWGGSTSRVLVCGGGRHNRTLMAELARRIQRPLETTDQHGIDGDSLEAAAFAWLAQQTLEHRPGNEPAVTGAAGPRILGAVYPGH